MKIVKVADNLSGNDMSPKKKNKGPAAQQLIDSLLDERTPQPNDAGESRLASKSNQELSESSPPDLADFEEATKTMGPGEANALRIQSSYNPDNLTPFSQAKQAAQLSIPTYQSNNDEATMQIASTPGSAQTPATNLLQAETQKSAAVTSRQATELNARKTEAERPPVDKAMLTELKTVVKMRDRFPDARSSGRSAPEPFPAAYSSSDAALKQSENLRVAQEHINDLERELERLRRENEQLMSAGETLRRRSDELLTKAEQMELQGKEAERIFAEERKVFRGQLQARDREIGELRVRAEEMENRLENNFKKIRVRERELEHRLEIVRVESQTLVATKDKMILELKRQIDQITHENDYAKQKAQEHFNQYKDKQETIRRVVRALRIALTILEGDDDSGSGKKSE